MESGNRKEDQRYENEVKLEIYNRGEGDDMGTTTAFLAGFSPKNALFYYYSLVRK